MSGRLITLATYDNVPLSEIARLRLEEAGIPVRIEDANIVNALWYVGSALGGVRLIVDEEHAAAAHALIADLRETPALFDDEERVDAPTRCLACGIELPPDTDRCSACGWSFADGAEPEPETEQDFDADDDSVARARLARNSAAPLTPRLSPVRDLGRPLISIWVMVAIAGILMGFLACVLTMLDDLFR